MASETLEYMTTRRQSVISQRWTPVSDKTANVSNERWRMLSRHTRLHEPLASIAVSKSPHLAEEGRKCLVGNRRNLGHITLGGAAWVHSWLDVFYHTVHCNITCTTPHTPVWQHYSRHRYRPPQNEHVNLWIQVWLFTQIVHSEKVDSWVDCQSGE